MDDRGRDSRGRADRGEAKAKGYWERRQSKNRIRSQWRSLNAVYKTKDKHHVRHPSSVHGQYPISLTDAGRIPLGISPTFELFDRYPRRELEAPVSVRTVCDYFATRVLRLNSNYFRLNRLRSCSYPETYFTTTLKMKHLAAYLLLGLGGNTSPSAADVKAVLESVGIEADESRLSTLISELEGKDINEVRI